MRQGVALALIAAWTCAGLAAEPESPPKPKDRPKVVLVLSGGGARGAAHIGVIRKLEEYHVPVDLIVGTSMGSIVGGLYAAGWSIDEIEERINTTDWSSVFIDRLPRKYRTFRRKTDDARFLVPIKMRFKGWKPYMPPALLGGQSMELLFKGLEIDATGEQDFDKLPIPYRAVAADFATGERVVLSNGSLAEAMQASMALPGIFPPVEIDGRALADGGMAANFPIRVAREMGADVIIGVDITSPLRKKEELGTIFNRLDQVTGLLTNSNKGDDMAAVRPQDVIIVPQLGELTFSDFGKSEEAIAAGAAAAAEHEKRLRELAVSEAEWQTCATRHCRRPESDRVVDRVEVKNTSPLNDAIVQHRIHVPIGEPLDQSKLSPQLLRLYSLDAFGQIHHDLRRAEDGKNVLHIDTPPKPYGRNSLQFGFSIQDNFQGDAVFNLAVSHLLNPVNRRGGEWRNILQFGENELLSSEFYQPLNAAMTWYVIPEIEGRRDRFRLYDPEGDALAEYRVRTFGGRLSAGRVLGNWGSVSVGAFRSEDQADLKIGIPVFTGGEIDDGGLAASFRVDTLDTVTWPRDGTTAEVTYSRSIDSFGADVEGHAFRGTAGKAATIGKNILYGTAEFSRGVPQNLSFNNVYLLGGFLRLSGLAKNELIGVKGGLARLLYYRELTSFSLGSLTQRMYAGISLEGGQTYTATDPVTWQSLRAAGSIFVGADTVIGPAYIAYGYTEGDRESIYLTIGQRF